MDLNEHVIISGDLNIDLFKQDNKLNTFIINNKFVNYVTEATRVATVFIKKNIAKFILFLDNKIKWIKKKIVEILENRFPNIEKGLATKDICYATQNRQDAVRSLAKMVDILLVIGAKNSSNSNRLRDLGSECGLPSYLINGANDIDKNWFRAA
jgi:4-hydroxy-3-methylbut-2-enyl diphosphate reductase IspH